MSARRARWGLFLERPDKLSGPVVTGFFEKRASERRTSTCSPSVMRNGPFGFSLMLWRSRRRPRCRCLKPLITFVYQSQSYRKLNLGHIDQFGITI